MKITLLAYGSRGDVQPYVALALALKERGHAPKVAAPANFAEFVKGHGLEYAGLEGDSRAMLDDETARRCIWEGGNLGFFLHMRKLMRPTRQAFMDSLLAASRGADMLLSSPVTEFFTPSLAEATGARCALSFLAPQSPSSHFAPMLLGADNFGLGPLNRLAHFFFESAWWGINREDVNHARRAWGLKPLSGNPSPVHRKKGGLVLFGYSPQLVPRPLDWPASHVVTGAWRLPSGASKGLASDQDDPGFLGWLEDGPPPVYFGFGSMPVPDHLEFLEMCSEICEELGLRALIGPGWNDLKMQACDLPDNLAIVEQADHAWLFPHCAAVVHHGGSGTTHAALAAGLPAVVCSFFADQPFWGRRVEGLGAGRHFRFQNISPARLRRALIDALSEPCQVRAAQAGAAMQAEQGLQAAADALERFSKA